MSTAVTYVGTQYNVPAYQDTGYAQGTGNLSSYLIALATGSLTLSGGTFTLTADVDFGSSFGLKATYYKSRAASPSTTGIFRMGTAENIGWRNNLDNGNLTIGSNSTDQLAYTGGDFITLTAGKGFVATSPDGTKTLRFSVDNNGEPAMERLT